jgi:hypothetical protein
MCGNVAHQPPSEYYKTNLNNLNLASILNSLKQINYEFIKKQINLFTAYHHSRF